MSARRRLPLNDNRDLAGAMAAHLRAGGIDLTDERAALVWLMAGRFTAHEVCAFADTALALARDQAVRSAMAVA